MAAPLGQRVPRLIGLSGLPSMLTILPVADADDLAAADGAVGADAAALPCALAILERRTSAWAGAEIQTKAEQSAEGETAARGGTQEITPVRILLVMMSPDECSHNGRMATIPAGTVPCKWGASTSGGCHEALAFSWFSFSPRDSDRFPTQFCTDRPLTALWNRMPDDQLTQVQMVGEELRLSHPDVQFFQEPYAQYTSHLRFCDMPENDDQEELVSWFRDAKARHKVTFEMTLELLRKGQGGRFHPNRPAETPRVRARRRNPTAGRGVTMMPSAAIPVSPGGAAVVSQGPQPLEKRGRMFLAPEGRQYRLLPPLRAGRF